MKEIARSFGDDGGLAGIATLPDGPVRAGLVLVNAGVTPKSGPYRLYVELARRLARDGVATLRFDCSGIGDSLPDGSGRPLHERTADELRLAVDDLHALVPGLPATLIGGLCSGAEDAFRHAERDPRITGVILIDPFAYRTAGWGWRHLVHRASRRTLRTLGIYEPVASSRRLVDYHYLEQADARRILGAMIERKARVHFIYTGGQRDLINHPSQLQRMFEGLALDDTVALDMFPWMDHTQLLAEDRHTLVEAIAARVSGTPASC